jgi:RNA polymerase sigma factor (sigma-70 family)
VEIVANKANSRDRGKSEQAARSWFAYYPALAEALSHPLLDAEAERVCFNEMQAAKKARRKLRRKPQIALMPELRPEHVSRQTALLDVIQVGRAAQERLLLHNLRLVTWVAKRYLWAVDTGQVSTDDLFDEGCIGLSEAIDHWNPDKGRFTTIGTWWVRRAIGEFLYRRLHTIRVPTHLQAKVESLRRQGGRGKVGVDSELERDAQQAGISPALLDHALNAQVTPFSLEAARDGEDSEGAGLIDLLAAPNSTADEAEGTLLREAAERAIAALPNPRWRDTLRLYCGFDVPPAGPTVGHSRRHQKLTGMSLQEVGEHLGISRQYVSNCVSDAALYLTGADRRHHLRALFGIDDEAELEALCQAIRAEHRSTSVDADGEFELGAITQKVQHV